jgi:hypothetical protein
MDIRIGQWRIEQKAMALCTEDRGVGGLEFSKEILDL